MKNSVLEALNMIPLNSKAAILQDNIEILKQLMKSDAKSQSGWDRVNDLVLTCLQVDRDEYAYDESEIAANFKEKVNVQVNCPAILFVPNKVIVGVSFAIGQDVEEKIPHVAFVTNDWKKKTEISRFARNACTKGGPFQSIYGQL